MLNPYVVGGGLVVDSTDTMITNSSITYQKHNYTMNMDDDLQTMPAVSYVVKAVRAYEDFVTARVFGDFRATNAYTTHATAKSISLKLSKNTWAWDTATWGHDTFGYEAFTTDVYGRSHYWSNEHASPKQIVSGIIKRNLNAGLQVESRKNWLYNCNTSQPELKARRLLRDMIGDEEFAKYLRRGFLMVKGRSGTLYRINGEHQKGITSYVKNIQGKYEQFKHYCLVFKDGNLPPTDGVIMRKVLLETDEFATLKKANVFNILRPALAEAKVSSLVEAFKEAKKNPFGHFATTDNYAVG